MNYMEADIILNARTDFEKLHPYTRNDAARSGAKLMDAVERIKAIAKDANVNVLIFDLVIQRESLKAVDNRDLLSYGNPASKGKKNVHPLNELDAADAKSLRDEITAARKAYGGVAAYLSNEHANMFLLDVLGLLGPSSPYVQHCNSLGDELPTLDPSNFDTYETAGGIDLPGFDTDQSKTNFAMSSAAKTKSSAAKVAKVEPFDPDDMDIDEEDILGDRDEGESSKKDGKKIKRENNNVKTEDGKVKIKQEEGEDEDEDEDALVEVIPVDTESHYPF